MIATSQLYKRKSHLVMTRIDNTTTVVYIYILINRYIYTLLNHRVVRLFITGVVLCHSSYFELLIKFVQHTLFCTQNILKHIITPLNTISSQLWCASPYETLSNKSINTRFFCIRLKVSRCWQIIMWSSRFWHREVWQEVTVLQRNLLPPSTTKMEAACTFEKLLPHLQECTVF